MGEIAVEFPSTDGTKLAGFFRYHPDSRKIAVISHPYGPVGGDMNNHVVTKAVEIMHRFGFSTLRFNFRGVSPSQGRTTWTGIDEVADVIEAVRFVQKQVIEKSSMESLDVVLIGYSYGSMISMRAANDIPNLIGLISISYPSQVMWALTSFQSSHFTSALHKLPAVPKLLISTTSDTFSSESNWRSTMNNVSDPKDMIVLTGDHFWVDQASFGQLIDSLSEWVKRMFSSL
jgi:alpha/beta superfamily hydrolase